MISPSIFPFFIYHKKVIEEPLFRWPCQSFLSKNQTKITYSGQISWPNSSTSEQTGQISQILILLIDLKVVEIAQLEKNPKLLVYVHIYVLKYLTSKEVKFLSSRIVMRHITRATRKLMMDIAIKKLRLLIMLTSPWLKSLQVTPPQFQPSTKPNATRDST